jgi:thiol-disulfide isomerase/thioredoxin
MRSRWLLASVALLALTIGLGLGLWKTTPGAPEISQDQLYAVKFPDVHGKIQELSHWRGKVLVLNFWATWCPPCREEIPDFVQVDAAFRDKGVAIVGIALDERSQVADFAKTFGIRYPLLLGGMDGYDLAAKLGNTSKGIPFTAIIDRQGKVAYIGVGAVRKKELEKALLPLL